MISRCNGSRRAAVDLARTATGTPTGCRSPTSSPSGRTRCSSSTASGSSSPAGSSRPARSAGTASSTARSSRPGPHMLTVAAQDTAGNVGAAHGRCASASATSSCARPVIQAKARTRFGVRVLADAHGALALRGKARDGEARPARPARAARSPGGTRSSSRSARTRPGDRRRGEAMSTAAHAGGAARGRRARARSSSRRGASSGWPGSSPGSPAAPGSPRTSRPTGTRRSTPARPSSARSARSRSRRLFHRWPWLSPSRRSRAPPARIPVHVGSTDSNLLVPLYAVIAGAAALLGWELIRGDDRSRELGPLAWPLGLLIGWSGLTLLWTKDLHEGAVALLFFWLPFGLLAVSVVAARRGAAAGSRSSTSSSSGWRSSSRRSASTSTRPATSSGTRR